MPPKDEIEIDPAELLQNRSRHRFFFVHIMKTAGGTLRQHAIRNFGPRGVYPDYGKHPFDALLEVKYLRGLSAEEREAAWFYVGHFPHAAAEITDPSLITLSCLRHPVDRTISYLRFHKKNEEPDSTLEQIYDDEFRYPTFIRDHQVKQFAMVPGEDPVESFLDVIDIDEARFKIAQENLERLDILGLTERFDLVLDTLALRFGWHIEEEMPDRHIGIRFEVSDALRQRIEKDQQVDIEFFEFAKKLHDRRAKTVLAPTALS